ncbi:hypothetical protein ACFV08_15505 [Streptomyces fradiae]|uniref:hypothetical protein n=1 Tax=Streptomyces fradiae TaxID=1906 RepID=UPI003683F827
MDLEALRHGNFATLGTAINDWSTMHKQLKQLETRARDDLRAKAYRAKWAGVNATVSREFIGKTADEFGDAVSQAASILAILRDTRDELAKYRDELNEAIDRAWNKKLTVVGVAGGGFKVYVNAHPEPPGSEQAMKDTVDELQGILDKATTSDSTAARALTALANQADHGFSGARYGDRDAAANALKKADEMAALAKDARKLTPEQLADFNRTLAQYKNDELFSAQFATSLGAEGTLQFWTDMSSLHLGASGSELQQLREFQKNLSTTLATATLSDSDGMTAWKQTVIDESSKVYKSDNPAYPMRGPMNAMGFQVMSSLMGHGRYDTEFLDAYGKKLLKVDMAPGGGPGMSTNDVWKAPNQLTDLVFGDEDGQDPMVGFMKALSHNPEAATNTFADKQVFEHTLESIRYTDRDTAVASALEAAVTGVPEGEKLTGPVQPHSQAQVGIMRNVMAAVADPDGGASLVTKETAESFGDMAAAYMPEISNTLAGNGAESIFRTTSEDPGGLERTDVQRFLYETARYAPGRAAIILGESIYTSSVMEAHIANPDLYKGNGHDKDALLKTIGHNAGLIEGIVGRSVADAHIEGEIKGQNDENDALKRKGDLMKSFVAAGVGVGTVALVGAQTSAQAMTGAAASGFFGGVAGMAIDRITEGRQLSGALDSALYHSAKDLDNSRDSVITQTQQAAVDSINRHKSNLDVEHARNTVRMAVEGGWLQSDGDLESSHVRPSA